MSQIAIQSYHLGKAYQLGEFSTGTLSRDIQRRWALMRGKEDPYLKIGDTNDRTQKGKSDVVWSLRDINFEINQGAAVGIIGRNGAGKSTLLKVLSRVTTPTTGNIKVKGRIASLLEVGTGFHPELTGRENIFLNGTILGMRKHEIKQKFDEIVDFAGVERYIDTPVKRYSSGMYVRLAFAVAAHLESEILIVDEVLAVGDAEFQKKCLGKLGDVSKGEGRTVLFVSHNMAALKKLCNSGIYLDSGIMIDQGELNLVAENYQKKQQGNLQDGLLACLKYADRSIVVTSFIINGQDSTYVDMTAGNRILIEMGIESTIEGTIDVEFHVEKDDILYCSFSQTLRNQPIKVANGPSLIQTEIYLPEMANGVYNLKVNVTIPKIKYLVTTEKEIGLNYLNPKIAPELTNTINSWGKVIMSGNTQIL